MSTPRPTLYSRHGMIAAAHPLAAQAGARLLVQGGNAFDAAVAVASALNVVEPFMSGMAGMGLATMWVAAEQRVRVLDFVPPIPASFQSQRFSRRSDLEFGAAAVGTPGNLAGWAELCSRYGRKSLGDCLSPAIALAKDGFALSEFGVLEFNEQTAVLTGKPALYPHFAVNYLPGGSGPVSLGTLIRQADLARTLSEIAENGADHLYRGPLGLKIVDHVVSLGGSLTMDDLAAVAPRWRDPLVASYRGLDIHVPAPPCEAFQFLMSLRILEGIDLCALEKDGADHLDLVYRAIRLAAGVRIAHNNPDQTLLDQLMGEPAIEQLRMRLRDGRPIDGPTEQWRPQDKDDPAHTTSFSIADSDGNLICVTTSLGSPFGSGVVVPGTGVALNNFLYWADVQADSPNRSKPGDDLPICMSPTISTRDGLPVLALGTPGSYGILQTQVQAIVQHLDFGLPLQKAIEAPRARLFDGRAVQAESRLVPETLTELQRRGHEVEILPLAWSMVCGGMQAVGIDPVDGTFTGGADPRRDGIVVAL